MCVGMCMWLWLWLWPVAVAVAVAGGCCCGGGRWVVVVVVCMCMCMSVEIIVELRGSHCPCVFDHGLYWGFWAWVSLLVAFVSCLFLCGGVCVRVRMCVFRV